MPPEDTAGPAAAARRRGPRYFYGWNIVGVSFLAHLAYAEQFSGTLGLFFRPLQNEFGWTRAAIAAVQTIARLVEALAAPFVGPLVDRYGARVLMPSGAIIVGLAMLAVTQVVALWQFYLLRGAIMAVGFTLMGNLVINVAINNWFVRRRGRAIAIAGIGNQFSNIIVVPLTVWVLAVWDWRTMFVIFALLTWLVVLLPSASLIRRRPEDMGLHPDGIDPGAAEAASPRQEEQRSPAGETASAPEPVWTRREAMSTGAFWMVAACFAVGSLAFQGINISLPSYLQDLRYGDAMVAAVVTFRAIFMATALPLMGIVAEQAHRAWIRAMPLAILGLSAFLFLLAAEPVFLWLAAATYGVGFGGFLVMQEVIWANYFGRLSLGRVRSLGYLVTFGFGAIGPIFMTGIFDVLGSYRPAFMLLIGLFVVAALMIGVTRPPRPRRHATAEEMAPSPPAPPR